MEIVSIKNNDKYLEEYIKLCHDEWGNKNNNLKEYIDNKKREIRDNGKVLEVLALLDNEIMIGFISLFSEDGDERKDLFPWYATMYVKKEYRGKGYSKVLNDELLKYAKKCGYKKIYLKSNLVNYYEKFGAIYMDKLSNGENLFYIDLN